MPIINLKIQGKQAIGDGTKIVCMNDDYVVRLDLSDCDTFVNLPIKKLVIKTGTDYRESPVEEVTEGGETFLQAKLPLFENRKTVELGVCSKQAEGEDPKFASEPALFECSKSILCGALILKGDPELMSLEVSSNGLYTAADYGVDGFYEIYVAVSDYISESRTVSLSMVDGNQFIYPTRAGAMLSSVTITKPTTLVPANIRKGIDIGGVVGTFETKLIETEIYQDGEYNPPSGIDGFSKVVVNVGTSNLAKIMRLGDSFTYDYDSSVNVSIDIPGIIKYENDGDVIIITAIGKGSCSVIIKDFDANGEIVKTTHYAIVVDLDSDYLLPVSVDNVDTMKLYLDQDCVGAVIRYTGKSAGGFSQDALYIVEEDNSEEGGQ